MRDSQRRRAPAATHAPHAAATRSPLRASRHARSARCSRTRRTASTRRARPVSARACLADVKVFALEHVYPRAKLLERIAASGVTVHEMGEDKFILKGRRRQVAQPGLSSPAASPQLSGLAAPFGSSPVMAASAP
jgi:hypothetical protein